MKNIIIRNVPNDVDLRLSELAKKAKKSKQEYLLGQLTQLAIYPDIASLHDKYKELFNLTLATIEKNTKTLSEIMEEVR